MLAVQFGGLPLIRETETSQAMTSFHISRKSELDIVVVIACLITASPISHFDFFSSYSSNSAICSAVSGNGPPEVNAGGFSAILVLLICFSKWQQLLQTENKKMTQFEPSTKGSSLKEFSTQGLFFLVRPYPPPPTLPPK